VAAVEHPVAAAVEGDEGPLRVAREERPHEGDAHREGAQHEAVGEREEVLRRELAATPAPRRQRASQATGSAGKTRSPEAAAARTLQPAWAASEEATHAATSGAATMSAVQSTESAALAMLGRGERGGGCMRGRA
jgi:hypothetical protein